jgi:hypothetical protein
MWSLGAREQGSVLLIVALFVAGALARTWRDDRGPAPPPEETRIETHGQDIIR